MHHRLGHPFSHVLHHLISYHSLAMSSLTISPFHCNSYHCNKTHKLLFYFYFYHFSQALILLNYYIKMCGPHLLFPIWIQIFSFLWNISLVICGFFISNTNKMFMTFVFTLRPWQKNIFKVLSLHFIRIMAVNTSSYAPFLLPMVSLTLSHILALSNTMAFSNVNIATLLKLTSPYFTMLTCL